MDLLLDGGHFNVILLIHINDISMTCFYHALKSYPVSPPCATQ